MFHSLTIFGWLTDQGRDAVKKHYTISAAVWQRLFEDFDELFSCSCQLRSRRMPEITVSKSPAVWILQARSFQ